MHEFCGCSESEEKRLPVTCSCQPELCDDEKRIEYDDYGRVELEFTTCFRSSALLNLSFILFH